MTDSISELDTLEIDSPVVAAHASVMGCTREEAWEQVKAQAAQILADDPKIARKPARIQAAPPSPTPAPRALPLKATTRVAEPPFFETIQGRHVLHLNGSQLSSAQALMPASLRHASNNSLLGALASGLAELAEEHPDAALLRSAAPTALDIGLHDPVRNAAIAMIQQRQYRFPFQDANVRIMSTDLNKTSLFHVASNNSRRRFCRDEPLGRIGDSVRVTYRGEELRHDDELVFMQLLHVARGKYPYEWIYAKNVPFVRGIRGTERVLSKKDTDNLEESLLRLRGGFLCIETRTDLYTLNLVKELTGKGSSNRILIDPLLVILYTSFTAMDTGQLFQTSGVARQLLKFICTIPAQYEQIHPIKIRSLFELCYGTLDALELHYRESNSNKTDAQVRIAMSKKLSDFRRKNLPAGLETLKSDLGIILDYRIDEDDDKVVIMRNPLSRPRDLLEST